MKAERREQFTFTRLYLNNGLPSDSWSGPCITFDWTELRVVGEKWGQSMREWKVRSGRQVENPLNLTVLKERNVFPPSPSLSICCTSYEWESKLKVMTAKSFSFPSSLILIFSVPLFSITFFSPIASSVSLPLFLTLSPPTSISVPWTFDTHPFIPVLFLSLPFGKQVHLITSWLESLEKSHEHILQSLQQIQPGGKKEKQRERERGMISSGNVNCLRGRKIVRPSIPFLYLFSPFSNLQTFLLLVHLTDLWPRIPFQNMKWLSQERCEMNQTYFSLKVKKKKKIVGWRHESIRERERGRELFEWLNVS